MKSKRTKKPQRSTAVIQSILDGVLSITSPINPITIRHCFYRLVGLKLIEKTEDEYHKLNKLLTRWRKDGRVSYESFVDSTRWRRGPVMFDSNKSAIQNTAETYRKNLWLDQPFFVECWVEKDAVSAIVSRSASPWGVSTYVCRGFNSLSALHYSSRMFLNAQEHGKQVRVLYFGDRDPSGLLIDKTAQESLANDFNCIVDFRRVAVTEGQIAEFNLPTRPTKSSSHSKAWTSGDSVELDTLSSEQLHGLVEREITSVIDSRQWEIMKAVEAEEREWLRDFASKFTDEQMF